MLSLLKNVLDFDGKNPGRFFSRIPLFFSIINRQNNSVSAHFSVILPNSANKRFSREFFNSSYGQSEVKVCVKYNVCLISAPYD